MKTFDEIVKWVRKNVPKENLGGHASPRAAAKWFVAYQEAQMMAESNNTKDWADTLICGIRPLNPVALVKEWAENATDAHDQPCDPVDEDELKLFFGVK